jgi:hypothetical protein
VAESRLPHIPGAVPKAKKGGGKAKEGAAPKEGEGGWEVLSKMTGADLVGVWGEGGGLLDGVAAMPLLVVAHMVSEFLDSRPHLLCIQPLLARPTAWVGLLCHVSDDTATQASAAAGPEGPAAWPLLTLLRSWCPP